jgi:hypothetical protein
MQASRAEAERERQEKLETIRRFFGPRRERFADDPAQGKLFETEGPAESDAAETTPAPVVEEEQPAAPRKSHRHGRRRFPAHFPRVRREHNGSGGGSTSRTTSVTRCVNGMRCRCWPSSTRGS